MKGKPQTILERVLETEEYRRLGILPLSDLRSSIGVALGTLSPHEARAARRAFRKAWRRVARAKGLTGRLLVDVTGAGLETITRAQRMSRKAIVHRAVRAASRRAASQMMQNNSNK